MPREFSLVASVIDEFVVGDVADLAVSGAICLDGALLRSSRWPAVRTDLQCLAFTSAVQADV